MELRNIFFWQKSIKDLFDVHPYDGQVSSNDRVAAIETGEGVIEVESFDSATLEVPESRSEKKKMAAFEQV